jgi:hypothetical protein
MMEIWIPVIVTVLGAGGPLMWALVRFDRNNTTQHVENSRVLQAIRNDVVDVKTDMQGVKVDIVGLKTDVASMKDANHRIGTAAQKLSERLAVLEHEI